MRSLSWLLPALTVVLLGACDRQVAGGRPDGPAVFSEACARCHGDHGRPPAGIAQSLGVKDLTTPEFRGRATQAMVEAQIRDGSANKVMPAFVGALTEEQIAAAATYVLTLSE